jgi:hypothetical protein
MFISSWLIDIANVKVRVGVMRCNVMNLQDVNRLLSVEGSVEKESRAGWRINAMELAKAREFLELQGNIKIRFTSGRITTGTHRVVAETNGGWFHVITLSQLWSVEEANSDLWHELAHAWQVEKWALVRERHPNEWKKLAYDKGGPYETNKWEVHARQVSEEQKGWLLIERT